MWGFTKAYFMAEKRKIGPPTMPRKKSFFALTVVKGKANEAGQ